MRTIGPYILIRFKYRASFRRVQKIVLFLETGRFSINFCIPLEKLGFFQEKLTFQPEKGFQPFSWYKFLSRVGT
jgi:hypothetical protein